MKVLKYILLGIGLILLASFIPVLGACIFLGFLIIGVLDAIGLIKVSMDDGVLLFGLYYLIIGH